MTYVLALDQGTTSSRAILFDRAGNAVATGQREFEQFYPQPGWVEHDPEEIWTSQHEVAVEALAKAGAARDQTVAVGITNQRETVVVWDRTTGEPIHPAIVWQDRRTAGVCDELVRSGAADVIRDRAGLVVDAYFSGTKIAWLLDHVAGARDRAERGELAFGTIDSWLIWKLTGGSKHVTDASNASRTMLFDLHTGSWSEELCELLRVPAALLPEVVDSSGVLGEVTIDSPLRGLPIAGIAGDQQAALFGQTCLEPGLAKNTYGTGCFLLANTGTEPRPSHNRLLTTVAWRIGGRTEFALEGGVFIGGAVVQWLRDGLGVIQDAAEIEALANQVEDTGDLWLVPAFAGLGAPDWDGHARGAMVGITRGTTRAHLARAALESIALQVADLVGAIGDDGVAVGELRVDGGAAMNDTLMQMQADLLQVPVVRPVMTETTALGAAYLAGLAVSAWEGRDGLASNWRIDRRFEPVWDADRAATHRDRWRRAVERSKDWA